MNRLRTLTRAELSDRQADLWDVIVDGRGAAVEGADGGLVGPFNAFLHAPELGHRLLALGGHLRFATSIERRLSEVAICTVGAHWRAEFEFWAHARMALDHGVSPDVIDAIRDGRAPSFERADERVVHAVATQLLVDGRVDDEIYREAADLLGEPGIVELVALMGYYCLISLLLDLFEVPLPDGAAPVWGA